MACAKKTSSFAATCLRESKNGYSRPFTISAFLTTSYDNYDVYGTPAKATDPNSVDTTRTLDARGRTLTVTSVHPSSDSAEPGNYVTTMVFDSRDRMTSSTFPLGNIVRYVYEDGTNRLLQTIRADSSGNEHERMLLTLNTIGRKTSEAAQECPTPANPCSSWTTICRGMFWNETYMAGKPLMSAMDPLRMMEPPSFISGRPFCTEKKSPFTLASK